MHPLEVVEDGQGGQHRHGLQHISFGSEVIDIVDSLQWPAMVMTVLAAWLVASQAKRRRELGFWCFLSSNVLWIVWGWHAYAYALVLLQIALAALNIRGALKNDPSLRS